MSITIVNNELVLDAENISVRDLHSYLVTNYSNYTDYTDAKATTIMFYITIRLINGTILHEVNRTIEFYTKKFIVENGCTFRVGIDDPKKGPDDGCGVFMCDVLPDDPGSVFGGETPDTTGNLEGYDSRFYVFCKWSWENPLSRVILKEVFIDGYGGIAGPSSILKKIKIKKAHGKYGGLVMLDDIPDTDDIETRDTLPVTDPVSGFIFKAANYFNPKTMKDPIVYNMSSKGYDHVLNFRERLDKTKKHIFKLRNGKCHDGYNIHRENNDNGVDFHHQFHFNPRIITKNGYPLTNAPYTIHDQFNNLVASGNTDQYGFIDEWINYYVDLTDGTKGIQTPHTVTVEINGVKNTTIVVIDAPYNKSKIYIMEPVLPDPVDYSRIQAMLDAIVADPLEPMAANIRAIKAAQGTNLAETKTFIESTQGSFLVL